MKMSRNTCLLATATLFTAFFTVACSGEMTFDSQSSKNKKDSAALSGQNSEILPNANDETVVTGVLEQTTTPANQGDASGTIVTNTPASPGPTTIEGGGGTVGGNVASAEGWSVVKCGGNLFTGVLPNLDIAQMNLSGWSAPSPGAGGSSQDGLLSLLSLLDNCMNGELSKVKEKEKLEYVLVEFNEAFNVTKAQAYVPSVIAGVTPADYGQCARDAGAIQANQSVPELQELVSASKLAKRASCGLKEDKTGACCIKL